MKAVHVLSALSLCLGLAASAHAADAVTDAMQLAYAPYRVALFSTSGKSQSEARSAVEQAQAALGRVVDQYGKLPPAPYDRDAGFAGSLAQVRSIYEKAALEIDAGKLPQAHETLEEARDVLAALRKRNGVIVFSDLMNAYHAEMEHLLNTGPQLLVAPQGLLQLNAQAGVLNYLARQLRLQASATLLQNAEFDTLLKAVEASVGALGAAAGAQDAAALKEAMGKVKAPYSKLFLKFG